MYSIWVVRDRNAGRRENEEKDNMCDSNTDHDALCSLSSCICEHGGCTSNSVEIGAFDGVRE